MSTEELPVDFSLLTSKEYPFDDEGIRELVRRTQCVVATASSVAVVVNLLVLLFSKSAHGGKYASVVYFCSMCISDLMVGLGGLLKVYFIRRRPQFVNCFLPDSLVLMALLMGLLEQPLVLLDVFSHMRRITLAHAFTLSKHGVIFVLVLVFCASAVIACLPQMDLNQDPFSCRFFEFHYEGYLIALVTTYLIAVFLTLCTWILVRFSIPRWRAYCRNEVPASNLDCLERLSRSTYVIAVDSFSHIIACLPLFLFILLHTQHLAKTPAEHADARLLLPLAVASVKAAVLPVVRCCMTSQVRLVVKQFCARHPEPAPVAAVVAESVGSSRMTSLSLHDVWSVSSPHTRRMRCLHDTAVDVFRPAALASPAVLELMNRNRQCSNCGFFEGQHAAARARQSRARSSLPLLTHPLQLIYQHWPRGLTYHASLAERDAERSRRQHEHCHVVRRNRHSLSMTLQHASEPPHRAPARPAHSKQSRCMSLDSVSRQSRDRGVSDVTTLDGDVTARNGFSERREGVVNAAFE